MGNFLHAMASILDGPGLLLIAFADSSFLTLPEGNDFLIVMLSTGNTWRRMAYYVIMTIVGSVIGCLLLYFVGRKGGNPLLRRRFSEKHIARAERLFEKYGILTVVVPSILPPPCPFKIFVLTAGAFRLKWAEFIVAVTLGRTIRYSTWGILSVLYGGAVMKYMQQNLHAVGIVLFGILIMILGTMLTLYFYRTRRGRQDIEKF